MIGNTYLGLKLFKNLFQKFSTTTKFTMKVKDFKKRSNKHIYYSLQSNSAKYNKPFKFIPWPKFLEGHHILSSDIWGKTFFD